MRLSGEDVELFYRLYHSLLFYVNKKFNIVKNINSPKDLRKLSSEEINRIRQELYRHPELIDSFVSENPQNFSEEELKIIAGWRNFVKEKFFIFRYLKKHTIFLDTSEPPKAFGVLALSSTFEEMIGPFLPVMAEAVLLPFKGKIIYDSILVSYNVIFGRGIRRSLNEAYQEAKSRFGIITSLPFEPEKIEKSDSDKLKFYLRSEHNREKYWEEINRLISKNPDLLKVYHQEMGKIHARRYGKQLREIGLNKGWFAILEGVIIAGGATKDEVERVLYSILPEEKRDFVYIFQLRERKSGS